MLPSAYDAAGNLKTDATSRTFTYDAENRQVSYNAGMASLNATYEYDGDGRRVKKLQDGITTVFVYDAQGRLAAEYSTQPSTNTSGTRYLTADHLGSTRISTNASGAVLTRHDYLPSGDEIASGLGARSAIAGYTGTTTIKTMKNARLATIWRRITFLFFGMFALFWFATAINCFNAYVRSGMSGVTDVLLHGMPVPKNPADWGRPRWDIVIRDYLLIAGLTVFSGFSSRSLLRELWQGRAASDKAESDRSDRSHRHV